MLVAGETQFNLIGFVLVMTASMLSGLRWTITQVLLQGTDSHGVSLMTLASLPAHSDGMPCHAAFHQDAEGHTAVHTKEWLAQKLAMLFC